MSNQSGWRWCQKCQGLSFSGNLDQGSCPSGGKHDGSKSAKYLMQFGGDDGNTNPQGGWRWCEKCQGLFWSHLAFFPGEELGEISKCPAGGTHAGSFTTPSRSGLYVMEFGQGAGNTNPQGGWRFCKKCRGLFFSGFPDQGNCPSSGKHNSSNSGPYVMYIEQMHTVVGDIRLKWLALGGPTSFLGQPLIDELSTPDGFGRFNRFEGGMIYWTPTLGAYEVHGAILDKWSALGFEQSFLGYPVSDLVRWRTTDPNTDQFIVWNLFENGAIVQTKNMAEVAGVASITPEQLRHLIRRAVDNAVHKLPDNIGLHPEIESTSVSGWDGSRGRAVTFQLHGFVDNGLAGDTNFTFPFALRFYLSSDPMTFVDSWFRGLRVDLIPGSVNIDVLGISGWFVSGNDYKQKIESQFVQLADIQEFPVTTYTDKSMKAPLDDQVKLVIIDIVTTAAGGLDFLVSPEPPILGTDGSFVPLIQQKIDSFVENF